jgi:hypothetical protein
LKPVGVNDPLFVTVNAPVSDPTPEEEDVNRPVEESYDKTPLLRPISGRSAPPTAASAAPGLINPTPSTKLESKNRLPICAPSGPEIGLCDNCH